MHSIPEIQVLFDIISFIYLYSYSFINLINGFVNCHSKALINFQEVFKKSLDGANKGYQDITNLQDNICLLAKQHDIPLLPNPYTTFTVEVRNKF